MSDAVNLAKQAAVAAIDKKATRVVILDLKEQSSLCRANLVCSGSNDRQTKAIAQAVEDHCAKILKIKPLAVEGKQSGHWILLDYGDTMVHVFLDYVRDYYAIEALWPDAKLIEVSERLPGADEASKPK